MRRATLIKKIQVCCSSELLSKVQQVANQNNLSDSELCREILEKGVNEFGNPNSKTTHDVGVRG